MNLIIEKWIDELDLIKNPILKNNLTKDLWKAIKYNKTKYGSNISHVLENDDISLVDADVIIYLILIVP